jgi:autotransporter-associated beta strand protein
VGRPSIYLGNISGAGGITKLNGSIMVLSGNNTYSGLTTINGGGGAIRATRTQALSNYVNAGSIIVNAGTVSVVAGGATGWTSGQIDTLRSNAVFKHAGGRGG